MKKNRKLLAVLVSVISPSFILASCGEADSSGSESISAHTHDYQIVSETPATCVTKGKKTYRCLVCGETKSEDIAALGHSFNEWHEKSPATCLESQVLERNCTRDGCNESETEDGDAPLGHLWGEWVTEGDKMIRSCQREGCEAKEDKMAPLIRIYAPTEGSSPFKSVVENYLKADDPNVHNYSSKEDGILGYKVRWINTFDDATSFRIECSKDASFSSCEVTEADANSQEQYIHNLEKATTYYIRIVAITPSGEHVSNVTTFLTYDLGPRVMKIDGIHNVRDVGGYITSKGRTLQGKIFRGGALSPSTFEAYKNINLSEAGKKYMSETLKIKTDFDLRTQTENRAPGTPEDSGLTTSPIPGATLEYHTANGYESIFSEKEAVRDIFASLSDETRYPVYLHCTGGADRTGTYSFLLNALLGVGEKDLIHDYEYTSFSLYDERNSKDGTTYHFKQMYEKIKTFDGDTLADKVENFLLSVGVTETQIYNIRAIMHGEETKEDETPAPITYNVPFDFSSGNITLTSGGTVSAKSDVGGYDGTVYSVKFKESLTSGGTYLFIGSYGFYLRGGSIRYAEIGTNGYTEKYIGGKREVDDGAVSNSSLRDGTIIGLSASIKDDSTMTLSIYQNNTFITSYDYPRVSNEIAASEAKFQITIGGDVTECVLSSPNA